jgi:hypothetical protein
VPRTPHDRRVREPYLGRQLCLNRYLAALILRNHVQGGTIDEKEPAIFLYAIAALPAHGRPRAYCRIIALGFSLSLYLIARPLAMYFFAL